MWGDSNRYRRHGSEMDTFDKVDTSLNLAIKSAKLLGGIGAGIGGAIALKKAAKRKEFDQDRKFAQDQQNQQFNQNLAIEQSRTNSSQYNPQGNAQATIFGNNASEPVLVNKPLMSQQNQQQKLLDAFNMKQAGAITEEEYNVIKKQILGF